MYLVLCCAVCAAQSGPLQEPDTKTLIHYLAAPSRKVVRRSIEQLMLFPTEVAVPGLVALREGRLRATIDKSAVILNKDGSLRDAVTLEPLKPRAGRALREVRINNRIRRLLKTAIPLSRLQSSNSKMRLAAARQLQDGLVKKGVAPVRQLMAFESDLRVRRALLMALAPYDLLEGSDQRQLETLQVLGEFGSAAHAPLLREVLSRTPREEHAAKDLRLKTLAEQALARIERQTFLAEQTGTLLYGISLGSVLLLTSLGLAITLGIMGVINMAHGELLMIGAYATFVVQNLFHSNYPELFDWYLVAAVPVAFGAAAVTGVVMERTVLRYLYGRPLETLLATWGISLILIQCIRLLFGASNVEVMNPQWLSGSLEINAALLPLNRIFCIVFTTFVCLFTWLLFQKTRYGLEVRAISQNRSMASAGGVSTGRIDMLTFGFGSGIAGLGGLVLTQLGNVGPELGQGYIVDSFLVVVFGGVGKIIGTVFAAMSLGVVNKLLEPAVGAVLGKILVLFLLVLFIQRRPEGLYAIRLREVEN